MFPVVEDLVLSRDARSTVRARLNYSRPDGALDPHTTLIHNARRFGELGLDRCGFDYVAHASAVAHWDEALDRALVKAVVYPEVHATLRAATDAAEILVFDHTLRDSAIGAGQRTLRPPVRRVLNDQTFHSAPLRVRRHLPTHEAAARLQRRFAIVSLWHTIDDGVAQWPLALCDGRTVEVADLIARDLPDSRFRGETYVLAANPRHRWYWLPQQTPHEAVLFKLFDSADNGVPRLAPRSSFEDPASPLDAPVRRTIEVRSLLFW